MFGNHYFGKQYFGQVYFGPMVPTGGKPYFEKKEKLKTLEEKQEEFTKEIETTVEHIQPIEIPEVTINRELTEANLTSRINKLTEGFEPQQDDLPLLLAIVEATEDF